MLGFSRHSFAGAVLLVLTSACTTILGDDFAIEGDQNAGGTLSTGGTMGTGATAATGGMGGMGTSTGGSTSSMTGPCPTSTHSCLPEAPSGWAGPLAVYHGPQADTAPGCAEGYPDGVHALNAGLEVTGSCGCSCSNPAGTQCGPVTFNQHLNVSCGGTPSQTQVNGNFAPNACKLVADYNQVFTGTTLKVQGGNTVNPGSCTPTGNANLPPPTWSDEVVACGGSPLGGCDPGQICAPQLPAGFTELCITQAGDVQCPSGAYQVRSVAHGDIEDGRSCEACMCATPTGTCGGVVQFRDGDCTSNPIGTTAVNGCSPQVQQTYLFATYVPSTNASCTPSNPQVVGTADGTQPVTFCCLP